MIRVSRNFCLTFQPMKRTFRANISGLAYGRVCFHDTTASVVFIRRDKPMRQQIAALATVLLIAYPALVLCQTEPSPSVPAKTLVERLGYPRDTKLLIVHGDDLGMAHSIDA